MPRSRPPYPPEFRAEAVEVIRSGTKTIRGLSGESRKCRAQYQAAGGIVIGPG
jgi:transposase-like protein